jgi:hypothetical protein
MPPGAFHGLVDGRIPFPTALYLVAGAHMLEVPESAGEIHGLVILRRVMVEVGAAGVVNAVSARC